MKMTLVATRNLHEEEAIASELGMTRSPAGGGESAEPPEPPEGPEDTPLRALLQGLVGPLALFLLFSAVSHSVATWYLVERVPPPPRPSLEALMASRLVQIMMPEEAELEDVEPAEATEEDGTEPVPVAAEPEVEPEPEPEPEVVDQSPPDESPARASDGGGYAALGGGDGAGGTGSYGGDGSGPPRSRQVGTEQQQERRQERTESARDRREARDRDEESARRVVRLEDTSEPPRPVSQEPALGYPRALREAAITGNVVLECIITDGGRVRACRRRQGPEELAEYVESIVTQWRFRPGMDHEGNAVVSTYTFRVPFRLN